MTYTDSAAGGLMAGLELRLLGSPEIVRDGVPAPAAARPQGVGGARVPRAGGPAGAARPPGGLVFGDAERPARRAALDARAAAPRARRARARSPATRWRSASRRARASTSTRSPTTTPTRRSPAASSWRGSRPDAGPVFDAWLLVERRRLAGACESVLHDAAHAALAAGRPLDGAGARVPRARAQRVRRERPRAAGALPRARRASAPPRASTPRACEVLFRRELGRAPDPRVRARRGDGRARRPGAVGDRAAALGQLEAGRAARRRRRGRARASPACATPAPRRAAVGDPALLARALAALGVALVHSVRGRDEEGAARPARGARARRGGRRPRGRGEGLPRARLRRGPGRPRRVRGPLAAARRRARRSTTASAPPCSACAAWRSRTARTTSAAIALLRESVAIARGCGDERRAAWSLAHPRPRAARCAASSAPPRRRSTSALALVARDRLGRLPAVPGGGARRGRAAPGRPGARGRAARPRVRARLPARRPVLGGDRRPRCAGSCTRPRATARPRSRWLRDAASRAVRVADPYVWIHAYCLDALAGRGDRGRRARRARARRPCSRRSPRAPTCASSSSAPRCTARALGDPAGVASARLLAEAIDNPDAATRELAAAA